MLSFIILMLPGPLKKPSQHTCWSRIPPLILPPKVLLSSPPGEHFLSVSLTTLHPYSQWKFSGLRPWISRYHFKVRWNHTLGSGACWNPKPHDLCPWPYSQDYVTSVAKGKMWWRSLISDFKRGRWFGWPKWITSPLEAEISLAHSRSKIRDSSPKRDSARGSFFLALESQGKDVRMGSRSWEHPAGRTGTSVLQLQATIFCHWPWEWRAEPPWKPAGARADWLLPRLQPGETLHREPSWACLTLDLENWEIINGCCLELGVCGHWLRRNTKWAQQPSGSVWSQAPHASRLQLTYFSTWGDREWMFIDQEQTPALLLTSVFLVHWATRPTASFCLLGLPSTNPHICQSFLSAICLAGLVLYKKSDSAPALSFMYSGPHLAST